MSGRFQKGERRSPATEFKPGQHWRPYGVHRDRGWLVRHYVTLGRSASDIAKDCGITENAVLFWLGRHGILRRTISEARALKKWGAVGSDNPMYGRRGAANPRYIDGSSPERQRMYCRKEGHDFLAVIRHRDGYRCVRCRQPKTGPRSLHVHHIKPWAGNSDLRFTEGNAVTLCGDCHRWVHSKQNTERQLLS